MSIDTELWTKKALTSLFSLWDGSRGLAFRNSVEKAQGVTDIRPTVTFNSLVAFEQFGLFGTTPFFGRPRGLNLGNHFRLFTASRNTNWFESAQRGSAHKKGMRQLIFVSHALRAVASLIPTAPEYLRPRLILGAKAGIDEMSSILIPPNHKGGEASLADKFEADPNLASLLLYYARSALSSWERIRETRASSRERLLGAGLDRYFEREIDRTMARVGVAGEVGFDAAGLAFSLRGLLLSRGRAFRSTLFFARCIEAVAGAQNPDGTWPDGVCAMIDFGADTLQQPSVKIATALADSVFSTSMLVAPSAAEIQHLKQVIPNLRKFARFLAATHWDGPNTSGWTSDRVRWPRTSETWITALAARFLFRLHLAERALARAETLTSLGASSGAIESPNDRRERWEAIADADSVVRPARRLYEKVIAPVLAQQESGLPIVAPHKNGVSVLLFGPPGSGKTFLVAGLARALGWPLVELNPSAFVSGGTELIESRATEIFGTLMRLNHAVVFFDECDELFRDRSLGGEGARNILSFITAAMLPKLQQLHDSQSVVFVVATNYLDRIDKAIRRPGRFDEVVLLDRPDARCRRQLIAKVNDGLSPDELSKAVAAVAGQTTKEILEYATAQPFKLAAAPGSVADYLDWCSGDGLKELDASRLLDSEKERIRRRWKRLKTLPS